MSSETTLSKLKHKVTPAMATPMDVTNHRVDEDAVGPLVDFLIERNVGGLFIGGTTGEGILLDLDERKRLHEAATEAIMGRVPTVVHVGANDTRSSFELASHAESIGADVIVAVTPYFWKLDDATLVDYFEMVAAAAPETPFMVYDIPQMAGNAISAEMLPLLAERIPTFAGVKCSSSDAQKIRRFAAEKPEGTLLLVGNEPIMLGSLAMGADGAISGLATAIPEPFVNMVDAYFNKGIAEARNWHMVINQMRDVLAPYSRVGGIKAILNQRGVEVGRPVPPRPEVEDDIWSMLVDVLA